MQSTLEAKKAHGTTDTNSNSNPNLSLELNQVN